MQRLTILCVGKLQESWWRDAAGEYEKRLTRYCDLRITELSDEKTPERASAAERDKILRIEGERILKALEAGVDEFGWIPKPLPPDWESSRSWGSRICSWSSGVLSAFPPRY